MVLAFRKPWLQHAAADFSAVPDDFSTPVLAMPAWHSKHYGRGIAGSYRNGYGYGKGNHYGKRFGNPYRASPYQHGRQGGLEQAIQSSFPAALRSTLEWPTTDWFALLTDKFTSADGQAEKPPPVAPSARVGSKLTRAIVGLFGGSQEKEGTGPLETWL